MRTYTLQQQGRSTSEAEQREVLRAEEQRRSFCGDAILQGAGLVHASSSLDCIFGWGWWPKPPVFASVLQNWRRAAFSDRDAGSMLVSITPQAFWHHSHRLLLSLSCVVVPTLAWRRERRTEVQCLHLILMPWEGGRGCWGLRKADPLRWNEGARVTGGEHTSLRGGKNFLVSVPWPHLRKYLYEITSHPHFLRCWKSQSTLGDLTTLHKTSSFCTLSLSSQCKIWWEGVTCWCGCVM
jgi:hypothetical protein